MGHNLQIRLQIHLPGSALRLELLTAKQGRKRRKKKGRRRQQPCDSFGLHSGHPLRNSLSPPALGGRKPRKKKWAGRCSNSPLWSSLLILLRPPTISGKLPTQRSSTPGLSQTTRMRSSLSCLPSR
ncbi:hypothetical protein L345_12138, partial [Ophiophagus hannah]